jgi:hypothetical protein
MNLLPLILQIILNFYAPSPTFPPLLSSFVVNAHRQAYFLLKVLFKFVNVHKYMQDCKNNGTFIIILAEMPGVARVDHRTKSHLTLTKFRNPQLLAGLKFHPP